MGIMRESIVAKLPNGTQFAAPLDEWIVAIIGSMTDDQKRKVLERLQNQVTLHAPALPTDAMGSGVGGVRRDVIIPKPTVIQHEPRAPRYRVTFGPNGERKDEVTR